MRYVKGLGYGLAAEVMCVIIGAATGVLTRYHVLLKLIVGLCTMTITLGLYFNWTYYASKRDKDGYKLRGKPRDKLMPAKMALIAPLPSYITLIALYLMKLKVIGDYFGPYLFLNIWIKPFADMFAEQPVPIDELPAAGVAGITLLILLQPAVVAATYLLTFNEVDVYKRIFFKKDE
jgi:hypothetical protein